MKIFLILWIRNIAGFLLLFRFAVLLLGTPKFKFVNPFFLNFSWSWADTIILSSFVLGLFLYWKMDSKCQVSKSSGGIDDALTDPRDDQLERSKFAERIFKLIDGTSIDSHLRVGVYGEWGSGKTTVLNFIKRHCERNGNAVAVFNPWQFYSRKEAWKGFVASIDRGLSSWSKQKIGQFEKWKYLRLACDYVTTFAEHVPYPLAKQITALILAPLKGQLQETKLKVQEYLNATLKDKRLYVFIDDIDRATPQIVYELLMLLNEIVDFNRCIYIIGLDRAETVHIIEEMMHKKRGYNFLEKIINWPFDLPIPAKHDWERLLRNELEKQREIEVDAITGIFRYLPKNARKLKHFIRYLGSLHKCFLTRFNRDEIQWQFLYLAQLLRLEYPEQFRKFVENEQIVKSIATNYLDKLHAENKETPEWRLELEKISKLIIDETSRNRFLELFNAMRETTNFLDEEGVRIHLMVVEMPELFTWKEFDEFTTNLKELSGDDTKKRLEIFFKEDKDEREIASAREFIQMLMRRRNNLLSEMSDVSVKEEQLKKLKEVNEMMRISKITLRMEGLFESCDPLFDIHAAEEWYGHLKHWAHFNSPKEIYSKVRGDEKDLVLELASKIASYEPEVLSDFCMIYRQQHTRDNKPEFQTVSSQFKKILDDSLANRLLERFSVSDGIKPLWGEDSYLMEKDLLFTSDSSFHNSKIYAQLLQLSEKASVEFEIQKNFHEYCRMLFYAAAEGASWARLDEVRKILKNNEVRDIVWKATKARPLNARSVGSLEIHRKKIIDNIFEGDGEKLSTPPWWDAIIKEFEENKNIDRTDGGGGI